MQQSFVGPNFFMSHCRCFLAMRFYHNHDQGPINALPVFFTTLPSICNFWYTLTNKGKQIPLLATHPLPPELVAAEAHANPN